MSHLSPAAAALLADLAAEHGIPSLAPDADGLVPMEIGDQPLAIAFSAAWDSAFLGAVLAADAHELGTRIYGAFAIGRHFAGASTRIAREPRSGALVLIAETALAGLHYPAFSQALRHFLADLALARAMLALAPFRA